MENTILTVDKLLDRIKDTLDNSIGYFVVEGEISNFSKAPSGHIYFSLSDKEASIACVMFKADVLKSTIEKELKDGKKVECSGSLAIYKKRGSVQVVAKSLRMKGTGTQFEKFEALKKKLSVEGLFDLSNKKAIPKYPKRVALITSLKGAAIKDFLSVCNRRGRFFEIVLVPSLVQGADAPQDLRKALLLVQSHAISNPIDVIVMTRGGGGQEDLSAFNDEGLAYDIFNCDIPIISAVGHEIDFSISDFVADLRCETPSAAAERITEHQVTALNEIDNKYKSLKYAIETKTRECQYVLNNLAPQNSILKMVTNFQLNKQKLPMLCEKLNRTIKQKFQDKWLALDDHQTSLSTIADQHFRKMDKNLENLLIKLSAIDPNQVLKRGFVILQGDDCKVVTTSSQFDTSRFDSFKVKFFDGERKVRRE